MQRTSPTTRFCHISNKARAFLSRTSPELKEFKHSPLHEVCIQAISRFSPIRHRSNQNDQKDEESTRIESAKSKTSDAEKEPDSHGPWQIREALPRSELYRGLTNILPHRLIKPQHEESDSRSRVHFIIPEKR